MLEADDELGPKAISSHKRKRKHTTPEALTVLCQILSSEEPTLTFDHLQLHRSCWRVLRAIKDVDADELQQVYGPACLEPESRLPFVAGYIFMTATKTKKIDPVLLPKQQNVVSS
jgi:hypothetical protein